MKIRKVREKDIEIINDIYVKGAIDEVKTQFPKRTRKDILREMKKAEAKRISGMKKGFKSNKEIWIVIEEDNEILGFSQAVIESKDKAEVAKIYVKKSARGRGIGKRLLSFILKELRKRKIKTAHTRVYWGNKPSIKLQEGFGFKIIGIGMEKRL